MPHTVEFYFDFRSPYSYMAYSQLARMEVEVVLKPMVVLKVMEQVGNVPTTLICSAKARYARVDLGRWAQRYGIPLNPTDIKAVDGEACLRAVLAAGSAKDAATITEALYRACWGEAKALTSKEEILAVLAATGIDTEALGARVDSPEVVATLERSTNEAAERGVFGSPTVFFGEQMFFGNDRLDFLREALAQAAE
ncbi:MULTISPECIES: 2-hydroxychromene-2-carboxylate isomerase [Pseudomonas]|uniref:2-hydroxychromene-2-carboxylate isomerase n=1 Tax=Pseudomonas abyssi TaxID=170540 RepID=A0A395R1C4_9PSED|nr:2-hydroxychromene-2-carboxylate isomerase [Halopseudomonas gallaeciensis]RGP53925.1 hypothetical protein ASB58_13150 [Halopseudomonas gallaeciensis]